MTNIQYIYFSFDEAYDKIGLYYPGGTADQLGVGEPYDPTTRPYFNMSKDLWAKGTKDVEEELVLVGPYYDVVTLR